jgi:hypothetical protein
MESCGDDVASRIANFNSGRDTRTADWSETLQLPLPTHMLGSWTSLVY